MDKNVRFDFQNEWFNALEGYLANRDERSRLMPEDNTGTFTDMENNMYPLEFIRIELTVEPHSYQEYGSSLKFCLESENRVPAEYSNGTFIMRVAYHNQTAVFRYDGKTITPSKE